MMMLNSGGGGSVTAVVTCSPWRRVTCFAASIPSSDHLRSQLDHLHSEADNTRLKASTARMRLLRLSEAAENLKRQAAISVRTGKEDDARDLLFQKKKVLEALEKSKARIELLDELSSKLHQAISLKERELIGNVALDVGAVGEDSGSSVRIVSPVPGASEELRSDGPDSRERFSVDLERDDDAGITSSIDEGVSGARGTEFGGFLERMDEQLLGIEAELVTVLRVSTLLLDDKEKTNNFKVQQTTELLESIRVIRQRIANISLVEAESK